MTVGVVCGDERREHGKVTRPRFKTRTWGTRQDNLLPSSLIANVARELSLYMNLFESSRFVRRAALRRASFRKPAATSTAFVSVKCDRRCRKMIARLSG